MAVKKTKREKKTSHRDFLNWLEGVKDMQPEDWVPDADQWKRIQEKIDLVDVKLDGVQEEPKTPMPPNQPVYRNNGELDVPAPAGPIPHSNELVRSTVVPRAPKQANHSNAPIATDPKIPVKTPDIDSETYESPFS
jgi:hypothetical protein